MRNTMIAIAGAAVISLAASFTQAGLASEKAATMDDDREAILAHIHSIFRAYMEGDEATIEATHSKDWTGFNSRSSKIVRGIDGYMANARRALANARITRYELTEVDVQIHGDIGIVYYVANWTTRINSEDLFVRVHARSVDVYQKRDGEWIQIGSNLNIIPKPGAMAKPEAAECFEVEVEG